jgi:hypothetical protein
VHIKRINVTSILKRLPLWSSGQSPWLQIQRSGFDTRRYQIFWEVVCLNHGPLSLVRTIEELLGRNSNGSGLENQEYCHGDPLPWPRDTLYPQTLTLVSSTSSSHSVSIVRSWTKAMEFCFLVFYAEDGYVTLLQKVVTNSKTKQCHNPEDQIWILIRNQGL